MEATKFLEDQEGVIGTEATRLTVIEIGKVDVLHHHAELVVEAISMVVVDGRQHEALDERGDVAVEGGLDRVALEVHGLAVGREAGLPAEIERQALEERLLPAEQLDDHGVRRRVARVRVGERQLADLVVAAAAQRHGLERAHARVVVNDAVLLQHVGEPLGRQLLELERKWRDGERGGGDGADEQQHELHEFDRAHNGLADQEGSQRVVPQAVGC